jgi:DNA-directed RNA polymerase specialized sigma24 family protein
MIPKSVRERFNTSKEELAKLGSEFQAEALPLLELLYKITISIVQNKRATKKIIKQIYFEAIHYCDITKNYADWWGWIHRIWMREIHDYYSTKENDIPTVFDFIDFTEVDLEEIKKLFKPVQYESRNDQNEIIEEINKLPAVLRIPMMMRDIYSLNYEKIAELIDVPDGVIATRIYRARKLLYLFLNGNYDYEENKMKGLPENFEPIIFDLRRTALLADNELKDEQKSEFIAITENDKRYKAEMMIQDEIKSRIINLTFNLFPIKRLKGWISRKAEKRFGKI